MTKFVVVMGGVISGVGKGITTASLGKILKEYGFTTTLIKIDPYINYDAGTLRPTEHGEVWVTDDGGEIDQDLGNYERFMNQDMPKKNNMTTGQIYKAVIDRERQGGYLGETVQFIPHIPQEIARRIKAAADGYDIALIEIGGTVGDYENVPFLFASKMLEQELGPDSVAYVLVTYLPIPHNIGEMKTKPTQQAIKLLREEGIFPDFLVCRASQSIDEHRKKKIAASSFVQADHIVSAPDAASIYLVPLSLERDLVGKKLLTRLCLAPKRQPDWHEWQQLVTKITHPATTITIAIVGKYITSGNYTLADSYVSIEQALTHAGAALDVGIKITWLDAQCFEKDPTSLKDLSAFDGIIVPGGFGASGVEGKMAAINYLRTHNIPYLGLCYGLQLACVEYARTVCSLPAAHTTEVDPQTPYPIIDILPTQKQILVEHRYGGTMRLGAYPAILKEHSIVYSLYQETGRYNEDGSKIADYAHEHRLSFLPSDKVVLERHRHRYEVNPAYVAILEEKGLIFSGYFQRPDGTQLMEFIELPEHPFFVATQAHPEFKSRLGNPSPLFYGFVRACMGRSN
jgi:CTP synthase